MEVHGDYRVNALFNALVNNDKFATLDFSSLRLTVGGGAPMGGPWPIAGGP